VHEEETKSECKKTPRLRAVPLPMAVFDASPSGAASTFVPVAPLRGAFSFANPFSRAPRISGFGFYSLSGGGAKDRYRPQALNPWDSSDAGT
jgi:hypothetical protein